MNTLIENIALSDVTDDDINRLQVELLYGRILKKEVRVEASRTLGVLREILADARKRPEATNKAVSA